MNSSPDTPPDQPVALEPLGPDDFDAQEAVLDALREQDEFVPDWEFCEGFLTALVCSRREVEPQAYWPVLLGEGFEPMANIEFVWRCKRRWQEIATALDADVDRLDDNRALQPEVIDSLGAVLALPESERAAVDTDLLPSFGQNWAEGYLFAVDSWRDDWAPPRDKEAARLLAEALAAIEELAQPDTGAPALSMYAEDGPPSVSERRIDTFAEAVWAAYDLRRLWKSLGPRTETIRKAEGPGRNDPCPCGSGKKFKKCHGA